MNLHHLHKLTRIPGTGPGKVVEITGLPEISPRDLVRALRGFAFFQDSSVPDVYLSKIHASDTFSWTAGLQTESEAYRLVRRIDNCYWDTRKYGTRYKVYAAVLY